MFLIIASKGSFNEMIYWTIEHAKQYASSMPYEEGVKYFKYTRDAIIQNHKFFWYHSLLAVILCLLRPINIKYKILGVTLLGFSFMTIVPGYFFYGHYWIQTVPGLALVVGLAFYSVMAIIKDTLNFKKPIIKWVYLGIFGALTFSHVSTLKSYYYHPNYERILRAVYGNNPFPESMEIANYINSHSKPEDNIVLIGSEPQIYFYTKRSRLHAMHTFNVHNVKKKRKIIKSGNVNLLGIPKKQNLNSLFSLITLYHYWFRLTLINMCLNGLINLLQRIIGSLV
ncbi:MAG: hypothetical protein IPJ60_16850 [Sphingobacteriaceae bacterium]|nr:hypothetical protein [Sphingobacteriaceae bacterium]